MVPGGTSAMGVALLLATSTSASWLAGSRYLRHRVRAALPTPAMLLQVKPTNPPAASKLPVKAQDSVGVLLLNLGGPDNLDAVEPFLYNLFADPEIVTLPTFLQWMNKPLAWVIATSRAPSSREGYASIGGSSPQLATTLAQGRALVDVLARRGLKAKSYVAMRYWHPFTDEALAQVKADGIQRLVVLPLYPQFSISTSGSSLRLLERQFYQDQELRQLKNVVIPAWYNRVGYVNSMARLIAQKCDKFEEPSAPFIFFSAHGLPKTYIEQLGDPYKAQTEATVEFVMARLRSLGYSNNFTLAYQSRVGPVQWLQPYTDDVIRELGAEGVHQMVTVPVSFVSEHIETLEEIDMEYAELAEDCGITHWERVPALGLDEGFIEDLASAVLEALPSMDERPLQEINEGRPVSLRVVNDLVQLRSKKDISIEYGPVRYSNPRVGFTPRAEVINGRIAMAAITLASAQAIPKARCGGMFSEVASRTAGGEFAKSPKEPPGTQFVLNALRWSAEGERTRGLLNK
eukprot:CAMPEP_0119314286 /NCGR_PEP_ID=MMETSP1333-20130426/32303_1 /TAXON_ID=418940 /ORGANISM="Scyphosphaera apsteinii, Strain RCC1455" /LENGTH=516 /DNA_ID=CAMNT_0007319367 /DNA_START=39 /DNA_END=1590 /DNA_ORIENTATION=+